MTKEEAANTILYHKHNVKEGSQIDQALDVAIEALRTAGDTISRQAAIDKFEPWLKVEGYSEGELNMLRAVLYELRFLPSAQPVNYRSTTLIDKKDVLDAIHKVIFSIIDTKSPLTVIDKQLLSINKAIKTKIKELPSSQPKTCEFWDRESNFCALNRPSAQHEQRWIPVTERLPENAKHPGKLCPKYEVSTIWGTTYGWYNPDKETWYILLWFLYENDFRVRNIDFERGDIPRVACVDELYIKAWRELPEPWKGGVE